ncbi:ABC transporter permease [uncultured Methanobrevibacter sp.]|uniref:ABC transporter permease n=1 Tax=uncultured Methanobrevibacter sp. TaxID=253161 RepID=UPI0025FCEBE7|nr:FtsX-like permease family protein [uncultured Methanobrevibacter sp.]
MKVAEITVSNTTTVGGNSGMIQQSTVDELQNIGGVIDVAGELSYSESSSSQPSMSQGGSGNPNSGDMTNSILGIEASKLSLAGIDELNGTAFEDNSKEAIIGSQYAMMNNLSIGDNITIHNTEFEITGIYETGSMFADSTIYVPIDTLQNISECDEYSSVLVKTAEDANDTIISDKIKDKFYDLSTLTSDEISSMMTNVTGILNTASLAVSGLAIIVGAIGIINTMVMTVYERTKEIGVLKSIGWKPRRILLMIMGETLVLTILSGIVGSVFGILISEIGVMLLDAGDFSLGYDPQAFILAFGITIFVGLIGGIYPAYKASKLAPTEALRYE